MTELADWSCFTISCLDEPASSSAGASAREGLDSWTSAVFETSEPRDPADADARDPPDGERASPRDDKPGAVDARAARALGHALEANHALRGLHLEGNAGCVDARGERGLRARARARVGGMKKL